MIINDTLRQIKDAFDWLEYIADHGRLDQQYADTIREVRQTAARVEFKIRPPVDCVAETINEYPHEAA